MCHFSCETHGIRLDWRVEYQTTHFDWFPFLTIIPKVFWPLIRIANAPSQKCIKYSARKACSRRQNAFRIPLGALLASCARANSHCFTKTLMGGICLARFILKKDGIYECILGLLKKIFNPFVFAESWRGIRNTYHIIFADNPASNLEYIQGESCA